MEDMIPTGPEVEEEERHSLLDPPTPSYSIATIRRAFVVWLYCGQRNDFKAVCDYYHRLEAMERKLPLYLRGASRQHEYSLLTQKPPTSPFQQYYFPNLYPPHYVDNHYWRRVEAIRNECVFDINTFKGLDEATQQEVIDASQVIKQYCIEQNMPLRDFLTEFKTFTGKCQLKNTISNVDSYIKRKAIHAELELVVNYTRKMYYLNENVLDSENTEDEANIEGNDDQITKDTDKDFPQTNIENVVENDDVIIDTNNYDFHDLSISDICEELSYSEDFITIECESNQVKVLPGATGKSENFKPIDDGNDNVLEESFTDLDESFKSIECDKINCSSSTDFESDFEYKPPENVGPIPLIKRDITDEVCLKLLDGYSESHFAVETIKCRKI